MRSCLSVYVGFPFNRERLASGSMCQNESRYGIMAEAKLAGLPEPG